MPSLFHPSSSRGFRDWDWLKTAHSFSFANYWDPNKMGFGLLRVLNDDTIAAGQGFDLHPHRDMEIVTIPLSGRLEHKDNFKHRGVIGVGDVQVMSAGTGITHSEFNASDSGPLSLLQLWVETDTPDHEPRYEDRSFPTPKRNTLQLLVSPDGRDDSLMIHQQAFFSLGDFGASHVTPYALRNPNHGVYVFLIDGEAIVNGQLLNKRDAVGIWDVENIELAFKQDSRVLLVEVPMG
jgi:hypothetical protein